MKFSGFFFFFWHNMHHGFYMVYFFLSPNMLFPGKFSAAKENLSQSSKFTQQTSFMHKCFMNYTIHRYPQGIQKCHGNRIFSIHHALPTLKIKHYIKHI